MTPASALSRPITDAEVEAYERDGVVHLRGVYPGAWVDTLRSALDEVFARDVSLSGEILMAGQSDAGARMDVVLLAELAT